MKKYLGILFLAAFAFRVINISSLPTGFTPDEASFGYDAYSLLQTGGDQWGNSFPLSLKSFGDYKLPLYSYLSMPFIASLGLNIFSTRLLSAILGSLAVIATYLFTERYFKNQKLAFVSALLLAFSPWHIALSRGAFEANMTSFFLPFGLWALADNNKKIQIVGAISLGMNLFSYHTARLLTIPILFVWALFSSSSARIINKTAWLVIGISVLLVAISFLSGAGGRLATSNIFSLQENVFTDRIQYIQAGEPEIIAKLFNNKLTYLSGVLINNYLEYLSPQFLILQGAREATYGMVPGVGVIYLGSILFVILGVYTTLSKKENRKNYFVLLWLLIGLLPASLSLGPGLAANRAAFVMPALQIMVAIGIITFLAKLPKSIHKMTVWTLVAIYLTSFAFFVEDYWYRQPVVAQKAMIQGTHELFGYLKEVENQYSRIIVTKNISEPHIFPAFYMMMDPREFQSQSMTWQFESLDLAWVDQLREYDLGKYTFKHINWHRDIQVKDALLVGTPREFPEEAEIIKQINYIDGSPAYLMVDTRSHIFAFNE